MKQLFILVLMMTGGICLRAQSLQDAKTLMYHQRYISASNLLRNMIKDDPRNPEAWYLLTRCYLKDDRISSFWDSIPAVPADIEKSPFIECAKGDVLLRHGKKDSAAAFFDAALNQSGQKDPFILLAIAIAHIRSDSGDPVYALALIAKAIRIDKKNPALYIEQGNAFRRLQDGTDAYKAYTRACEISAAYAEAYYRLGKLFATQNNPELYLKYYQQAVAADSLYAPAWYALYYHYYFINPEQAMTCLDRYMLVSDFDKDNSYRKTDLLYLSKKYSDAVRQANLLVTKQPAADPRIFKLLAYSYRELNDSVRALENMRIYFERQQDTALLSTDYESMADMMMRFPGKEDSAAIFLSRTVPLQKDSAAKVNIYKNIADIYKKIHDYENQGIWLGRYYNLNPRAGNVDLFNWGMATYLAKNYPLADSIFKHYADKYPDQTFGYYWKARADIAMDTTMELGLAVPSYQEVIKLSKDDSTGHPNKRWLIEAYGYLAAFEANTEKNYPGALEYLEKLLVLDPDNKTAKKYVEILKKNNARSAISKNK
jgi:Tfp pilus assembly protein PilF